MLQLLSITKSYGDERLIDDLSLTVGRGEIIGLIGPNGSGKSTVLGIVSGLIAHNAGRVLLEGDDISSSSVNRRVRVGIRRTFQDGRLFPSLTVDEVLALGRCNRARALSILEMLAPNVTPGALICDISRGQCKAVELAHVLAAPGRVVLLDEPCSGLAVDGKVALAVLLRQAIGDRAALIAEHDHEFLATVGADAIDVGFVGAVAS